MAVKLGFVAAAHPRVGCSPPCPEIHCCWAFLSAQWWATSGPCVHEPRPESALGCNEIKARGLIQRNLSEFLGCCVALTR